MAAGSRSIDAAEIAKRIIIVRGQRVLLDADLAALYGVPTRRLNEQIRRNQSRFPSDFMFRLKISELQANRSQFATGSRKHRDPRFMPFVFTEHGAIMAATVLNSPRAVQMTVFVVRAFVKMREGLLVNAVLAREIAALKARMDTLDASTRKQFEQVFEAILGLSGPSGGKQ